MITVLRKKYVFFANINCNDMITDAAHPAAFSFLPACVRAANTGKVRLLYFVVLFMILSILQKMVFFTSELR